MRIAAFLLLAAAAPVEACPVYMSPGEQMLIIASSLFSLTAVVLWGLGLLSFGLSVGERGRHPMALATLSAAFLELAFVALTPLAMALRGSRQTQEIAGATALVMCLVAPILAWRALRASEARGGLVMHRAGSPLFPLALLAVMPAKYMSEALGTGMALTPLLALIAVVADRAPAPRQAAALAPLTLARGHCPVCRELVRDRVEECARCHTPHHRECLAFNGRCGIFACEPGAPDPTAKKKPVDA
jgi:hypothetical protein